MKLNSCVRAAVLAVLSLWASSAMAQVAIPGQLSKAQAEEIYCVPHKLIAAGDVVYDVAEVFLYEDNSDELLERADTALRKASEACEAEYKWDLDQLMLGEQIGVYISAGEYLIEELYVEGLDDEEIDLIFAALGKLSVEDQNRFLDDSWLDDAEFSKRLNATLVATKYPGDDEYFLETARLIMEVTMLTNDGTLDWLRLYGN